MYSPLFLRPDAEFSGAMPIIYVTIDITDSFLELSKARWIAVDSKTNLHCIGPPLATMNLNSQN